MRFVGGVLPLDVLPPQFFIGLGGTEQIGGQLSAAHVVKNFLVRFQPLAGVNIAHSQAAI